MHQDRRGPGGPSVPSCCRQRGSSSDCEKHYALGCHSLRGTHSATAHHTEEAACDGASTAPSKLHRTPPGLCRNHRGIWRRLTLHVTQPNIFKESSRIKNAAREVKQECSQWGEASTKSTNLENFVAPSKLYNFLDCTLQSQLQPSKEVGEDKRKRDYRAEKL